MPALLRLAVVTALVSAAPLACTVDDVPGRGAPPPPPTGALGTSTFLVNEVRCGDAPWVEVINQGADDASLAGLRVSDAAGAAQALGDDVLPPGRRLVVALTGLAVPCGGGVLSIGDASTRHVDTLAWTALRAGETFGRIPDASGNGVVTAPTEGLPNALLGAPGDPRTALFDPTTSPRGFALTFTPDARAALRADPDTAVPAVLQADDEAAPRAVTVRLRHTVAPGSIDERPDLRIELATPYHNVDQLLLSAMRTNLTGAALAEELARSVGVVAPRRGIAALTIDGEARGVFALVEPWDEAFVAQRFASTQHLYEAVGVDVTAPLDVSLGDAAARADLDAANASVAAAPPDELLTSSLVDWQQVVTVFALERVLGQGGGYTAQQRYAVHVDAEGRVQLAMTGAEDAAGQPLDAARLQELLFRGRGSLWSACLASRPCTQAYVAAVDDVAARVAEALPAAEARSLAAAARWSAATGETDVGERLRASVKIVRANLTAAAAEHACRIEAADLGLDYDHDERVCALDCVDNDDTIYEGAFAGACEVPFPCVPGTSLDACPVCAQRETHYMFDVDGRVVVTDLLYCGEEEGGARPYAEAAAGCEARGGQLIAPAREVDWYLVGLFHSGAQEVLDANEHPYWIGLDARETPGTYRWVDGRVVTDLDHPTDPTGAFGGRLGTFYPGEPSGGADACATVDLDDLDMQDGDAPGLRMRDVPCAEPHPFVCSIAREVLVDEPQPLGSLHPAEEEIGPPDVDCAGLSLDAHVGSAAVGADVDVVASLHAGVLLATVAVDDVDRTVYSLDGAGAVLSWGSWPALRHEGEPVARIGSDGAHPFPVLLVHDGLLFAGSTDENGARTLEVVDVHSGASDAVAVSGQPEGLALRDGHLLLNITGGPSGGLAHVDVDVDVAGEAVALSAPRDGIVRIANFFLGGPVVWTRNDVVVFAETSRTDASTATDEPERWFAIGGSALLAATAPPILDDADVLPQQPRFAVAVPFGDGVAFRSSFGDNRVDRVPVSLDPTSGAVVQGAPTPLIVGDACTDIAALLALDDDRALVQVYFNGRRRWVELALRPASTTAAGTVQR